MKKTFWKRFWSRVKKTKSCWNWIAAKNTNGYGNMCRDGKVEKSHRLSWEAKNGPIPKGLWVLHHCDNPSCVRPSHLHLGDHPMNTKEAVERNRFRSGKSHHWSKAKGCLNVNAVLTENIVRQILKHYRPGVRGFGMSATARKFRAGKTTVANVVSRRTWKHVNL